MAENPTCEGKVEGPGVMFCAAREKVAGGV